MIRSNIPLAQYTTFKLGGPASSFATFHSEDALVSTLKMADGQPLNLLGSGSNLLVHDEGVDSLVVANRIDGISFKEHSDGVLATVGAGVDWDDFVSTTISKGLQGLECLSGIPGRVGGAPVQNIGAYGQSISDVLHSVRALDQNSGEFIELGTSECAFDYRRSIFQNRPLIVTSVQFLLRRNHAPQLSYQDLKKRFENIQPSLVQVRQAVLETRGPKGALLMNGWPRMRSAGSFFKNPTVNTVTHESLVSAIPEDDARTWYWPQKDGSVKVAAGRLIESAGFKRGFRDGAVGNSPHHSLSLIAFDGATSAEIVHLARRIQERVHERFGIILDVEPQLWGWENYPLLRSSS